jgi:hypothetical protein
MDRRARQGTLRTDTTHRMDISDTLTLHHHLFSFAATGSQFPSEITERFDPHQREFSVYLPANFAAYTSRDSI